jgi:transcriptional regulator with XRE-family HTH domain
MSDPTSQIRRRLSENVMYLRSVHRLSQEELAERVGNTNKHIGEIERGTTNVRLDILISLAQALSVDVADLFRTTTIPQPLRALTPRQIRALSRALGDVIEVMVRESRQRRSRKK